MLENIINRTVTCMLFIWLSPLYCNAGWGVTLFGDVQHADSLPVITPDMSAMVRRHTADTIPQPPPSQLAPMPVPSPSPVPLAAQVAVPNRPLQASATLERPALEWMMIPPFMPGSWSKKGDMTVSVADLRSGISTVVNSWTDDAMTVTWGHQVDRRGNVWHAIFIPSERDGASDGELVRFVTVGQQGKVISEQQFVTKTQYVVTEAYRGSNQVADRFQQESLNDYVPESAIVFQNKSSNKMFDMRGRPYRFGVLSTTWNKVGNFVPAPTLRGVDMRQALADFLHEQHLDELIPTP